MDRLNQLRAGAETSRGGDSTLDTSSPPSEAYMSANDSSKYFSLADSTFDISPIKDVSYLATAASSTEPDHSLTDPDKLLSNLSPVIKKDVMLDSYKVSKQIEAANILSGGVDIFEDNDNSFDGDELVIDDNVDMDDKSNLDKSLDEVVSEATLLETHVNLANKDTEVVLQIDGKNVDAIDIGNGLYLYRKAGHDELAAVQIITEEGQQAPSFKFLKVRENVEGNLEVYEEFEIEVSKDVPVNETKLSAKKTTHMPIKDTSKVISESLSKLIEKKDKTPPKEVSISNVDVKIEVKDPDCKGELNFNGKMMKFNESRKSPVVGSFTPMTYHSTPNKEGKPLTKTMVDQQLHPSRHSDNVKKTIEVHTDSQTKRPIDENNKLKPESHKNVIDIIDTKVSTETETIDEKNEQSKNLETKYLGKDKDDRTTNAEKAVKEELQNNAGMSTDDQTKIKVDDKVQTKVNILETTKVSDDNKQQEQEASKTLEAEVKDSNKEKEEIAPVSNSLNVPETIPDLVCTNIVPASLPGTSKINKILETESEVIQEQKCSITDKTNAIATITTNNDEKSSANVVVNESTKPKTNTVKIQEKIKGKSEQKLDITSNEKAQETASNTVDQVSINKNIVATEQNLTIPDKESPENISEHPTQTLHQTEIHKDSKLDNKKHIEDIKTLAVSSIPKATSMLETSFKEVKQTKTKEVNVTETIKETEQNTLVKAEISCQLTNTTEVETDGINSIALVSEPNIANVSPTKETKLNLNSQIEKDNQVSKTILKPDLVKGVDLKTNTENLNTANVIKGIEFKTDAQQEKINIIGKTIDLTTAPKAGKTIVGTKLEPKTVSQTNKLIPVIQVPKSATKIVVLNPTENKFQSMAVSQNYKVITDPIANIPKTYFKSDKPKANKEIEPKSKFEVVNPLTKGSELKTVPKTVLLNPIPKGVELTKIEKTVASQIPKSNAIIITSNKVIVPSKVASLANVEIKIPEVPSISGIKPINNNHTAVPFGKWTDANRQEFLNKFKDIKVPASSNTKQIKNSNDLNRIDVLKKIDSQRSTAKGQDKLNVKDTVFSSKIAPPKAETKIPIRNEGLKVKAKPEITTETVSSTVSCIAGVIDVDTPEPEERREVNVNDLIGRAIVDMLNRPVPMPMTRSPLDEPRHVDTKDAQITSTEANVDQKKPKTEQKLNIDQQKVKTDSQKLNIDQKKLKTDPQKLDIDQKKQTIDIQKPKLDQQKLDIDQQKIKIEQRKLNTDQQKVNIEQKVDEDSSGSLDDIEMKMNELHGIPFVERPPHELPRVHKTYSKSKRNNKGAKSLPATSKQSVVLENVIDLESEEEVIEHEPITGDIDLSKKVVSKSPALFKPHVLESTSAQTNETQKKEPVFTENDFDKFARRNSITYENCLTVNFDGTVPANVVQSVKEKDASKVYPKNETIRVDAMTKLPRKQTSEDNKNNQSKIHSAYQSALTVKRQMDRPSTIIEDKPVKVVFMDASAEFIPNQLNVQGKELSPAKKSIEDSTKSSPQTISSEVSETVDDKQQDELKTKTKHQRKQVLTPVEAPDLELIQPRDIGFDVSPKKKRKTDESKTEKTPKNLVHKKSYLLGRAVNDEKTTPHEVNPVKETINRAENVTERTVSAIDNLVKAAELLENQSVHSASPNPDSQQNTPVKRGRGRPRKYPLPDGSPNTKSISPSPQKRPRLIDTKPVKTPDPMSDEENSDIEQMIRENWTMGKINENIVCPICNKLFRSENVVFKHVKHCTGVSPTRSELEKRSPRRRRYSKESGNKSFDSQSDDMEFDEKPIESVKNTPKKCKSKESNDKLDEVDIIVIEDTPVKELVTENEPVSETIEEKLQNAKTVDESTNYTQVKNNEKHQTTSVVTPIREKTLKEIADEKAAEAKKLQVISEDKIIKTKKLEDTAEKPAKAKKLSKTTVQTSNLVCEFCGKTFRQLSYLANHKLQHKKEHLKKLEAKLTAKLQVFSCEVCKKEFRMLYHLVQHRNSHNSEAPSRSTRKSSSEQNDNKVKEQPAHKQNEDTSAGFRCEPCDKSFRKLHHLVEHRETHDGINRQKTNAQTAAQPIENPPPPPQCDVCNKTFRKLHHLIEHKEQYHVEQVETSSEKSDDKSVLSSLSTRDIIHECSLCYMVFPNEHSLKKHFIICQQKKKRQLKPKPQNAVGVDTVEEGTNTEDSMDVDNEPKIVAIEIIDDDKAETKQETNKPVPEKIEEKRVSEKPIATDKTSEAQKLIEVSKVPVPREKQFIELKSAPAKRDLPKSDDSPDANNVVPEKIKKIDDQQVKELPKKTPIKDKVAPTVTKRQKSVPPLPILPEGKPVESSDDDEVRYMLNPKFNIDETSEGKVFLKVRSNKRNSLQIERPNSRELIHRRTSLQHPPKIPRLKAKAIVPNAVPTMTKNVPKPPKIQAASGDSDDSDVKYSFPEVTKPAPKLEHTLKEKKATKKSLVEKRKSLGGIAKRKSMGQTIAKNKVNPSPVRVIKRRTLNVEHRCDCGQLFNSAALLSRHTSLAHTPPRIRRRRSPPPEPSVAKPPRNSTATYPPPKPTRKSSVRNEPSNSKPTRKSSAKSDTPETRKSKEDEKSSAKPRRTPAHRGVPVPEKMRKLMMKVAK